MPRFSKRSRENLETCDPDLQRLFHAVIAGFDITVLCGHRTQVEQMKAYHEGRTQRKWPESLHNQNPSRAIDVCPYPIDWEDRERFTLLAGYVLGIAETVGIRIRWGGDWNRNMEVGDNRFDDLPHFELIKT